jgi:hypothetical protein
MGPQTGKETISFDWVSRVWSERAGAIDAEVALKRPIVSFIGSSDPRA